MSKVIRKVTSGTLQLSPNFYLSEFTDSDIAVRHGLDNTPNPVITQRLFQLAGLWEEVRTLVGNRVISISSGYRSPEVNKIAKGSPTSEHMEGTAGDGICRSFGTPYQLACKIAGSKIKFGQLIFEGTWVHLSLPGIHNQEILTAHFKPGEKTTYTNGL